MKKTLLLFAILLAISCTNQKQDFVGIADFKIGADFNSIPNAEKFTNVMPNEYNMRTYNLSQDIGSVSDLNITTSDGKISEVKFVTNENTNTAALEKITQNLVPFKFANAPVSKSAIKQPQMNFYTTPDSTLYYAVIYKNKNLKNGSEKIEYHYSSKDVQVKKMAQILAQSKSKQ